MEAVRFTVGSITRSQAVLPKQTEDGALESVPCESVSVTLFPPMSVYTPGQPFQDTFKFGGNLNLHFPADSEESKLFELGKEFYVNFRAVE